MKSWPILALCGFLSVSCFASGGDGTRGGGYAVRCDDGKVYAWDFVNEVEGQLPLDPSLAALPFAEAILAAISDRLEGFNVPMAESLRNFASINTDILAPENHYLWLAGIDPLKPLGDETQLRIPQHCIASAGPDTHPVQAVVREPPTTPDGKVLLYYDPPTLEALKANSAVQLAFLYLHEWLRDFVTNSDKIPPVVQLLHAKDWGTASEFNASLKGMGLTLPAPGLIAGEYAIPDEGEAASPLLRFRVGRAGKAVTFTPLRSRSISVPGPGGGWSLSLAGAAPVQLSVSESTAEPLHASARVALERVSRGTRESGHLEVEIDGFQLDTGVVCVRPRLSAVFAAETLPIPSQDYFCHDETAAPLR